MNDNKKIVLLIDFNNLVFCSHYTSPQLNKYGEQVNTIKNFFYKLRNFKDNFNPDYIVFASDIGRSKTFRRKLYANYKAQRKPIDENISKQMAIIEQLLILSGFTKPLSYIKDNTFSGNAELFNGLSIDQ